MLGGVLLYHIYIIYSILRDAHYKLLCRASAVGSNRHVW
jgi:hypothetical protein